MPENQTNIRAAVRRNGAQKYILISLVSFASTVMLTRLFLSLTGYPKIGGGELHIAHVLWGGLILFIAALLPLIFANTWVFNTGAILSGIGVGLFIDEVGKFITMNNDYFFPPAAPIIYALFLLTVLVYMRVSRPPAWNARTELYHVLDNLTEILDRDLEPNELETLRSRLTRVLEKAPATDSAHLAQSLMDYLNTDKDILAPERLTRTERMLASLHRWETRFFNRSRVRLVLILALAIVGSLSLAEVFTRLFSGGRLMPLESLIALNMMRGEVRSMIGANWFFVHMAMQMIVAILAFVSITLMVSGREKRGLEMGTICMVLSLTMVNLLAFFVDQFSAALTALIQLAVFLTLIYYRQRYFKPTITS